MHACNNVRWTFCNCEQSELSSAFNGPEYHYIYIYIIFQVDRHSVNVLRVSKYPPNVIFRSANINVQRENATGSMNWHNNVEPPM